MVCQFNSGWVLPLIIQAPVAFKKESVIENTIGKYFTADQFLLSYVELSPFPVVRRM
jgi:hypothetical protein